VPGAGPPSSDETRGTWLTRISNGLAVTRPSRPTPSGCTCSNFQIQRCHHCGTLRRVEDAPLAGAGDSRFTTRLRLEPVGPANAADLWRVNSDDEVSYWYGNDTPSLDQAEQWAQFMVASWRFHGVHKWIAYDRISGEVIGRGGLSRTPVDDDWGQI
jgi:hypothetical protein